MGPELKRRDWSMYLDPHNRQTLAPGMSSSLSTRARFKLHDIHESSSRSSRPAGSPCSPRLEKLEPGLLPSPSPSASPSGRRSKGTSKLKDLHEQTQVRNSEAALHAEYNQQEQQRGFLFHTRWLQLRNVYAVVCETMATRRWRPSPMSPLPPCGSPAPSLSSLSSSASSSPLKTAAATPSTTAQASELTGPASWLRDVASEFQRTFAFPEITIAQLEIAMNKALRIGLLTPAFADVTIRLKAVLQAFQRQETLKVDFRELLCALFVLDRWRIGERKLVTLWFVEFAAVAVGPKALAVPKHELKRMLFTACEGSADEKSLMPIIKELCGMGGTACSHITEGVFTEYAGENKRLASSATQGTNT